MSVATLAHPSSQPGHGALYGETEDAPVRAFRVKLMYVGPALSYLLTCVKITSSIEDGLSSSAVRISVIAVDGQNQTNLEN